MSTTRQPQTCRTCRERDKIVVRRKGHQCPYKTQPILTSASPGSASLVTTPPFNITVYTPNPSSPNPSSSNPSSPTTSMPPPHTTFGILPSSPIYNPLDILDTVSIPRANSLSLPPTPMLTDPHDPPTPDIFASLLAMPQDLRLEQVPTMDSVGATLGSDDQHGDPCITGSTPTASPVAWEAFMNFDTPHDYNDPQQAFLMVQNELRTLGFDPDQYTPIMAPELDESSVWPLEFPCDTTTLPLAPSSTAPAPLSTAMSVPEPSHPIPTMQVQLPPTINTPYATPHTPPMTPVRQPPPQSQAMAYPHKKVPKIYSFLQESKLRTNEHSRMGTGIWHYVHALDQKTAPFIILYIARPESVCHANGKVFHFMSKNLTEVLGDTFLESLHNKVMDFVHEQVAQRTSVAESINFVAEKKRRQELERENEELRRQLKRQRTESAPVS
ncbi:hypothetical protein ONZ51_g6192 [Trametes cubensis]|uniref:Uncharacterized protein n=1 Tax=Trametes cubensis TaxID=1111947 RepID=A0AAD7TSK3_9APHY|nr:hypothetical protein ONZ51_g6192 [Trametes cubensis]